MGKRAIWHNKLGRLIRENNPHEGIDKTTTWCYDTSGNIASQAFNNPKVYYNYGVDILATIAKGIAK